MSKRRTKKRQGLHKPSFVGGILIGVGGTVLVFLGPALLSEQLGNIPVTVPGTDEPQVVFEFPELLRSSEVPVNPKTYGNQDAPRRIAPAEPAPATPRPAQAPAQPPAPEPVAAAPVEITEIYIQAASFRDRSEAEQLRARLLLQGLPANMGEVVLEDGAWHRVTVGPIDSAAASDDVMTFLREQNLTAIRINPG